PPRPPIRSVLCSFLHLCSLGSVHSLLFSFFPFSSFLPPPPRNSHLCTSPPLLFTLDISPVRVHRHFAYNPTVRPASSARVPFSLGPA
ncbi:hypothetical protein C7212DRAFT_311708, partial [Tuber magnatum]